MSEQDRTPVSDADLAAAARARVDRHEAAVGYLDGRVGERLEDALEVTVRTSRVEDLEGAARGDGRLASKALEELNGRADLGSAPAKAALKRIATANAEKDSRKAPGDEAGDEPATIEAGDRIAELLMRNGHQAIRGRLVGVITALEDLPLEVIEASIAYTEQAIRRMRASALPNADDAVDNATRELEAFRLIHGARRRIQDLAERHAARARLKVTP